MVRCAILSLVLISQLAVAKESALNSILNVDPSSIDLSNKTIMELVTAVIVTHNVPELTRKNGKGSKRRDRHPTPNVHPSKLKLNNGMMTSFGLNFGGTNHSKEEQEEPRRKCLCKDTSLEQNYVGDEGNVNYGPGGTGAIPDGFWSYRNFSPLPQLPYTMADSYCDSLGLELYTASSRKDAIDRSLTLGAYFSGRSGVFLNLGVVRSGGNWYRYTTGEPVEFMPPGDGPADFSNLAIQTCLALSMDSEELVEVDCYGEYYYLCRPAKKARTPKMFC
ncbi:uncharacterized protein LOC106671956 isoform X2 [Cimex lectularius]|uniref:C-type lectin n=1 Tax=Cimex lectularius TaxID=79782 RepID=A0A8I6S7U2_CIMLE|nr:uncharacterized protein LOC106671956 isoform X2 [Cimex lectularius]